MTQPRFDKTTGWWNIRIYAGQGKPRPKFSLMKHPGWKPGMRVPRKAPDEVNMLARKYLDMEVQAKHGIDITPSRPVLIKDYLAEYHGEFAATRAESSITFLGRTIRYFVAFCDEKGVKNLKSVTTDICREFLLYRLGLPRKISTVIAERDMISPCFRRAARDDLIPKNPWPDAKIEGKARLQVEEPIYWTEEELAQLIANCNGWVKDLAVVAVNSGLRITSLLNIEWRDIDFTGDGKIIVRADLKGNKSRKRYDAPLLDAARDVLQRLKFLDKGESPFLFPSRRTGKPQHYRNSYVAMTSAVKRAGLPEKGHYNHILRHTFITLSLMRGVPLPIVSRWAGHSTIAMTMKYFHACKNESARYTQGLSFGSQQAPDLPGSASSSQTSSPPATPPSSDDS